MWMQSLNLASNRCIYFGYNYIFTFAIDTLLKLLGAPNTPTCTSNLHAPSWAQWKIVTMTIHRSIHQAMVAWATLTVQTSFWKSGSRFRKSNAHACGCSGAVVAVAAVVGVVAAVAMVASIEVIAAVALAIDRSADRSDVKHMQKQMQRKLQQCL